MPNFFSRAPRLAVTVCLCLASGITLAESLLNGLAAHSELNKVQFIGAVYTNTLTSDSKVLLTSPGPKRMEMRVVTNRLSPRRFNSMWIEGMAINNPHAQLAEQAENMALFASLIKHSLVKGDTLKIRLNGEQTDVILNEVTLGSIPSSIFFQMMLKSWVGSVPLSSDFRDQLLTSGKVDTALRGQYEALQPAAERQSVIADWQQPATAETEVPAEAAPTQPTIAAANPIVPDITPTIAPTIAKPELSASEPAAESAPEAPTTPEPVASTPEASAAIAAIDAEEEAEDAGPILTAATLLARQKFHSDLVRWTYKYISYPKRALKRNQEGSVRLSVIIDRSGKVIRITEVEPSKFQLLNDAAKEAVKSASPFPAMPTALEGELFAFTLPVVFRIPD